MEYNSHLLLYVVLRNFEHECIELYILVCNIFTSSVSVIAGQGT